jgi:hypothetical protein
MSTPPPTVQRPPPTSAPADVPWWGALILAILTAIVSVIGTILYMRGSTPIPGAPPGIGMIFTDAITFIPHILIVFGIFADIFTLQGAYSIPSLVGLMSIPIHYVMQFLWTGVAAFLGDIYKLATTVPAPATNTPPAANNPLLGGAMSAWSGCEVYGFESLKSPYAPQGLVVTATIFWYYLLDLWINRDGLDSVATAITFPIVFGLQAYQIKECENFQESMLVKSAIALAEGFIIGGTGYGIIQSSVPDRLPSSVLPTAPRLSSMTRNPDGTYTDSYGNVYIVGPDGKPIKKSFIAAAVSGGGSGGGGGGGFTLPAAGATTCPT